MPLPPFVDLHSMTEEQRIRLMAHRVMKHGEVIGFLVELDADGKGTKGDRYIAKLSERYPTLQVMSRFNGPTAGLETITIGVVKEKNNHGRR